MSLVAVTGIKPTGTPHIGNYVGAIKPALALATETTQALYFIADYHALTGLRDPERLDAFVHEVAATWLALGLNPEQVIFYRQSDVPQIFELAWILSCVTPKGLMNRAHAYKALLARNLDLGEDADAGVNMGVFGYPLLMAADILLFGADLVPVGGDQTQHVEIARDVARRFNAAFGPILNVPKLHVLEAAAVVVGLDGRKMSKRYGNTIPIFAPPAELRKRIMSYVTDSSRPDEPKNPLTSPLFALYRELASAEQVETLRRRFLEGIGWGEVKEELFSVTERVLAEPRRRFTELLADRLRMDALLTQGAERARALAASSIARVRRAVGVR